MLTKSLLDAANQMTWAASGNSLRIGRDGLMIDFMTLSWERTFYTNGRCKGRSYRSSVEILRQMALYYLRIQGGSSLSIYWHA